MTEFLQWNELSGIAGTGKESCSDSPDLEMVGFVRDDCSFSRDCREVSGR